jgi:MFS superfamily sulfate permease-like transporter
MGKLQLTRMVNYIPTCILEAFMPCVGYKMFKYALKFCEFDIPHFVPAAIIGV